MQSRRKSDKVSPAVEELLGCSDHMNPLVQELPRFFLGDLVLNNGKEDLYPYLELLRVFWSSR